MKMRFYSFILAFALAFGGFGVFHGQAQVATRQHVVQPGETLYRISKQYGVTVEEILRHNTGIEGSTVKVGQTLQIPTPLPAAAVRQLGATTDYKVKRKETIWGIAHAHGLTVEELVLVNPEMREPGYALKRGSVIRIPSVIGPAPKAGTDAVTGKTGTASGATVSAPVTTVQPSASNVTPTVKVAVMLPFVGNSGVKERCIEYYRGFLMAVDSVKRLGQSVEVYAFDTPAGESLASALSRAKAAGVQAVVGPFYGDHITQVGAFAAQNGIKAFVPFTSKAMDVYSNTNLCLLNAPEAEKWQAVLDLYCDLFPKDSRLVVLRTTKGNEKAFTDYMSQQLQAKGHSVVSLWASSTDEQYLSALAADKRNVLLPDASDPSTLDELVPTLTRLTQAHPERLMSLMGYPDWQTYISGHLKSFFALNTYIYTNFYYDNYSPAVKRFERDYRAWFHADLMPIYPRMALLGFDNGLHILQGLARYGEAFSTQRLPAVPYQSAMHFVRAGAKGGIINNHIWFVHYRPDGHIEKIEEK